MDKLNRWTQLTPIKQRQTGQAASLKLFMLVFKIISFRKIEIRLTDRNKKMSKV